VALTGPGFSLSGDCYRARPGCSVPRREAFSFIQGRVMKPENARQGQESSRPKNFGGNDQQLSTAEHAALVCLLRSAKVGGCCKYLGISTRTLDRLLFRVDGRPIYRSRVVVIARVRERLASGTWSVAAWGDA
jgi:hypothetical protein